MAATTMGSVSAHPNASAIKAGVESSALNHFASARFTASVLPQECASALQDGREKLAVNANALRIVSSPEESALTMANAVATRNILVSSASFHHARMTAVRMALALRTVSVSATVATMDWSASIRCARSASMETVLPLEFVNATKVSRELHAIR